MHFLGLIITIWYPFLQNNPEIVARVHIFKIIEVFCTLVNWKLKSEAIEAIGLFDRKTTTVQVSHCIQNFVLFTFPTLLMPFIGGATWVGKNTGSADF